MNILFWNMCGRPCEELCANLAMRHTASIILLAECPNPPVMLKLLNRSQTESIYFPQPMTVTHRRVVVFSHFRRPQLERIYSDTRYAIYSLSMHDAPELLIVAVHAKSGVRANERQQNEELRKINEKIIEIEKARGHDRTVVVGDFNAQPFDYRMASTTGFHAVMSRRIAAEKSRVVDHEEFRYFYNPMWKFYANRHPAPQGTYFYRKARPDEFFWNMFDQFLLRPSLLRHFNDDGVEILTTDGVNSFQTNEGRPNRKTASDHFPILVKLTYPETEK